MEFISVGYESTKYLINRFILQELGDITEGVRLVDNLIEHLGRNATNYFVYDERPQSDPPSLRAPASQSSRCTKPHQLPD